MHAEVCIYCVLFFCNGQYAPVWRKTSEGTLLLLWFVTWPSRNTFYPRRVLLQQVKPKGLRIKTLNLRMKHIDCFHFLAKICHCISFKSLFSGAWVFVSWLLLKTDAWYNDSHDWALRSFSVKVPQIIKLLKSQSGEGISMVSVSCELLAISASWSYGYASKFPFRSVRCGNFPLRSGKHGHVPLRPLQYSLFLFMSVQHSHRALYNIAAIFLSGQCNVAAFHVIKAAACE